MGPQLIEKGWTVTIINHQSNLISFFHFNPDFVSWERSYCPIDASNLPKVTIVPPVSFYLPLAEARVSAIKIICYDSVAWENGNQFVLHQGPAGHSYQTKRW